MPNFLSREQVVNINLHIDASNELLERMKKGLRDVGPRLERLDKAGFFIEGIMVNGQLIEHALKGILHACKLKRQISEIMGKPDPYENLFSTPKGKKAFEDSMRDFNRKELGKIIGLFRQTTGENDLAYKLEKFNTFRIEFIHHVFNGSNELAEMDKQAKEYLGNIEFGKMIINIAQIHMRMKKEIDALHQIDQ